MLKDGRTRLIVVLKSTLFLSLLFGTNRVLEFGTSLSALSLAIVSGTVASSILARTQLRSRGFFGGLTLLWTTYWLFNYTLNFLPLGSSAVFLSHLWGLHIELCLLLFSLTAAATWVFWRVEFGPTFEAFFLCAFAIYFLSGHRKFHLDSPKIINSLAWQFGLKPQIMFLLVGAIMVAGLLLYVRFSNLAERLVKGNDSTQKFYSGRLGQLFYGIVVLFVAIILYGTGNFVYINYQVGRGVTSNGVGQENKEGSSPLGFHSALGSTNQPAALVRLEGDYPSNPYTPMLYLRESALSQLANQEIVIAAKEYDTEVPRISPGLPFKSTLNLPILDRISLVQSIYTLADQTNAFAVDYPIEIRPLKNPEPNRFKQSYRAYSMVPSFDREKIKDEEVGDPNWPKEMWDHYLQEHPDSRYGELAQKLGAKTALPLQKAFAILDYLSENSIYTLTPNHEVPNGDDPVAPYLFGDFRGYCVHFAHATVYMLRSLGIPARIGTGYMTDLSQAKDGHILLRMADRHAWAEVYVKNRGWLPFDIQPQHVESHADTQIDMNLLEELMSKLDPGQEILPKEAASNEANMEEERSIWLPSVSQIQIILLALAFTLLGVKSYQRFSWRLPGSLEWRLKRLHHSTASAMADFGYARHFGETKLEYKQRLESQLQVPVLTCSLLLNRLVYSPEVTSLCKETITLLNRDDQEALRKFKWWRHCLAFLNPSSIFGGV